MLKINLSGEQDNSRKREEAVGETSAETTVAAAPAAAPVDTFEEAAAESPAPARGGSQTRTLLLLALLVVVAAAYFKKDTLMGLFAGKEEPLPVVTAPPPKAPEPAPEVKEPDPTFVVLTSISDTVPPRVWLSSLVIMYDGAYEVRGMAFSHDAIVAMIGALGGIGDVASQTVPPKSKAPDAVYQFAVSGKLKDLDVPEILDAIPIDTLVQFGDGLKSRSADYGVTFHDLPKAGRSYTDADMPFALEGPYEGLRQVVADLCPEGGGTRIFRLVIAPAAPGRVFDKVKASFSLRTVSAI